MKKIALALSLFSILLCSWLIIEYVQYLDIASNKTDWHVADAKNKISERTDIDLCEKRILQNTIDINRANDRDLSGIAFQAQLVALVVIIFQFILSFLVLLMPNKKKNSTSTGKSK